MAATKPTEIGALPATPARAAWRTSVRRGWSLYLMLIPALIVLVLFHYYPMYGVVIAFQKYNPGLGFTRSPWVGLDNFVRLFGLADFWRVFTNTLIIAISKIVTVQVLAILVALMLHNVRLVAFKRIVQTTIYLPHFLSWIVLGGILIDLLSQNGLVNRTLGALGLGPFLFLGDNTWFRPTLIVTNLWKEVGWATIIYLAALTGIDPQLYEAAAIDGAGTLQQTRHITLPGIRSTIVLIAALSMGSVLNAGFDQVLTLYNPAVYATGDILDTYIYRLGLVGAQFSLAAAAGLVGSVLSFGLIALGYWAADRWADYRLF
jgi:putative aldouronate transport system permease protein